MRIFKLPAIFIFIPLTNKTAFLKAMNPDSNSKMDVTPASGSDNANLMLVSKLYFEECITEKVLAEMQYSKIIISSLQNHFYHCMLKFFNRVTKHL